MSQCFFVFILTAVIVNVTASNTTWSENEIYGDIFNESRSLAVTLKNGRMVGHKCQREVPAIFYQVSKNEPVRGNGSTIYFHRIEVCCEGYIRSSYEWHRCVPDCSIASPNNCRNGFCRAPNQCDCFDEFVRNDRGECVHTCPIACEHGRCYLNGTCECEPGYSLDPQTRKFCRPDCHKACGNQQECIAPEKCACREGYKEVGDLGCQPICIPDCGHGKCVGPNVCECFSGYMKRPQRNVCEAECHINCENGFCESRYKCQCRDGYKYGVNTTSCLPDCGDKCENGVCIAPGFCRCYDGYELKGSTCEPMCQGGCGFYGKCIETNVCSCGSSQQRCIQGSCNAKGKCRCSEGLTHFIDSCVPPTMLEMRVSSYEQRDTYDRYFLLEFEALIGNLFKF